jgi:hypothetical protein
MRVHLAGCCKGQAQQHETMQCETMQCEQQSAVTTIFENTHVYGTIFGVLQFFMVLLIGILPKPVFEVIDMFW